MKRQHFFQTVLVFVTFMFLQGCSNDTTQMAQVKFILVDAPGDYKEVNIDLRDVLINRSVDDTGWESIGNVKTGIYNLLDYTGGMEALIADTELPAGEIKQVRLLLGPNNTIKLKNATTTIPLDTPSALQTGLKLQFNTELIAGITYTFILDFDADKSIVKAGNSGKYNLKPVIRVTTEALSGAISGKVTFPTGVTALSVTATLASDITKTYSTQTDVVGNFFIKGVLPGTYNLTFEKSVTDPITLVSTLVIVTPVPTINPVIVTIGNVKAVGTVTF